MTERERQMLLLLQSLTPQAYADLYQGGMQGQAGAVPILEGPILAAGFDTTISPDAMKGVQELYDLWNQGVDPAEAARAFTMAIANKEYTIDPVDQEKILANFSNDVQAMSKSKPTETSPYAVFGKMDMPELAMLAPALQEMQKQQQMQTIGPSANTLKYLEEIKQKADAEIAQSQKEISAYTSGEKKRPKGVFENIAGGFLKSAAPIVAGIGTAGAIAASPFTGGATLAAIPVLAGLAGGTVAAGGTSAGANALLNWAYGGKDKAWAEKKIAPELEDIKKQEERLQYVKQMAAQQAGIAREAQKIFDKRFAAFLESQGGAPPNAFDVARQNLIRGISG